MPYAWPFSSGKFQSCLKQQYLGQLFKKEKILCHSEKEKLQSTIKATNTTQPAYENLKK